LGCRRLPDGIPCQESLIAASEASESIPQIAHKLS